MKKSVDFVWDKVWTTEDFGQMGWRDVALHGVGFSPYEDKFALDIDYIFEWIEPNSKRSHYDFYVAPATLIFENIHKFEFEMGDAIRTLQIKSIERKDPQRPPNADYIDEDTEWEWTIDFEAGSLLFRSVGYKQYIRKEPVRMDRPTIPLKERGGVKIEFID